MIINGEYIQTQMVKFHEVKWGGRFYFAGLTFNKVGENAGRYPEENAFISYNNPPEVEKPLKYRWVHFGHDTIVERKVKK